jgi:hypothetical protein
MLEGCGTAAAHKKGDKEGSTKKKRTADAAERELRMLIRPLILKKLINKLFY